MSSRRRCHETTTKSTTSSTLRCEDVASSSTSFSGRSRRHDADASSSMRRRRRRRRRYDIDVVTTTTASASLSWRQSRHVNVVVTSCLRRHRLICYLATSYDDDVRTTSTSLQRNEDLRHGCRRCHDVDVSMSS